MDILELIEDREQTVAASSARPFSCPEEGCSKVGLRVVFPITLRTLSVSSVLRNGLGLVGFLELQSQVGLATAPPDTHE